MKWDRQNFLSFWTIFCPSGLITAWEIKNKKEMKKNAGDIIILHMCTKNHDHMMYDSWDMVRKRQTDWKSDI